jgi:hypothetical protein
MERDDSNYSDCFTIESNSRGRIQALLIPSLTIGPVNCRVTNRVQGLIIGSKLFLSQESAQELLS